MAMLENEVIFLSIQQVVQGFYFYFIFLASSQLTMKYSESEGYHALSHSGAHTCLHGIWLCVIK